MATTFKFHLDAGLVTPKTGNLIIQQADDGSTGPVDTVLYIGSNAASRKIQAVSNPGADPILVTIVDADPGPGQEASAIKLATTQGGLAAATPGASLNMGTTISSGPSNSQAVWIRIEANDLTIGTSTELSLKTVEVQETAI
jgi:hypothetical protein